MSPPCSRTGLLRQHNISQSHQGERALHSEMHCTCGMSVWWHELMLDHAEDFLIQGGDATGTGQGCESIYGKPYADEIHPRQAHSYHTLIQPLCEPVHKAVRRNVWWGSSSGGESRLKAEIPISRNDGYRQRWQARCAIQWQP
eukprot:5957380-Amphidinium_carterae.1